MPDNLARAHPAAPVAPSAAALPATAEPLALSIVVPTFNEVDNVETLVRRLDAALVGIPFEIVFVDDDSPDATAAVARALGCRDLRVRCVQRVGRRGLSSACIEGMLASSAPLVAVMDADLQHDEGVLPLMVEIARAQPDVDVVVASRYAAGGGVGDWAAGRLRLSRLATTLSRLILPGRLSDPMSGFFLVRREVLEGCVRRLSGVGFKILLDLFASSPRPLRHREVAYTFRPRRAGVSKLDARVAWDFLILLLHKLIGALVPVRFLTFSLVGGVGIGVHFAVLSALYGPGRLDFETAQAVATAVAMTGNFALNNALTYRDMRLAGWAWLRGWVSFCLGCSVGALANVGIAAYLFHHDTPWGLSALVGVVVGAVWNYAVTSVYTWKHARA